MPGRRIFLSNTHFCFHGLCSTRKIVLGINTQHLQYAQAERFRHHQPFLPVSNTRTMVNVVPRITASHPGLATQPSHVQQVSQSLEQDGILKVSLEFTDQSCHYLARLLRSLHVYHGHSLPISHSASCGWFWDVRPSSTNFQSANHQARSETTQDFPWHTDCSYEFLPPRYFALQVLQHDRCGGGTLSVMNVDRLSRLLSKRTLNAFTRPEFRIAIPKEFIKSPTQKHITGSLFALDKAYRPSLMRFREDLLTPLTEEASQALSELRCVLSQTESTSEAVVQLTSKDLPTGSIIMLDNRRWLHARNHVKDPRRHLRRVRWDASPFPLEKPID